MKNIIFTFILFFSFIFSAHCQLNKGNWLLEGGLNFTSYTDKDSDADTLFAKAITMSIRPALGWFIKDNLVIGLSPSFSHTYENMEGYRQSKERTSSFAIAPFIQYYRPLSPKWAIFAKLNGINLNFSSSEYTYIQYPTSNYTSKSSGYQLGLFIAPGLTYFISSKVGLSASLGSIGYGFNHNKIKKEYQGESKEPERIVNSSTGGIQLSSLVNQLVVSIAIHLPGK